MTIVCGASRGFENDAAPGSRTSNMKLLPLVLPLIVACVTSAPALADAADADAKREPELTYRIQPGDLLFISVWKEADLQSEVLVRPDGGLSFPLAGEQLAAGHTI